MPQLQDSPLLTLSQNCVARALYDNIAESPDELAFRRGDVLTVLEQNTAGIEGWWLCALRGRQGICPGNRLRLLPGVYDPAQQELNSLNTLQRQGKRRSWHVQPNKVLTPQKFGDVYLYDLPANRQSQSPVGQPRYDVPPTTHTLALTPESQGRLSRTDSRGSDSYDVPPQPTPVTLVSVGESYDVPRPLVPPLTPSSSLSSLTTDSLSAGSNRSSLAQEYDVPRPRPGPQPLLQQQVYDVPPPNPVPRELPLELSSALDCLERLESEAATAVCRLLAFVTPGWRTREALEPRLLDIKLAVVRLRTAVHDLAQFTEAALGNAAKAPDKGLVVKLRPLVSALRQADTLVCEVSTQLESTQWSLEVLCRPEDTGVSPTPPDSLDQLVACARALTDDVRQATSFIQGNATLLFKRGSSPSGEWMEDYDYVNLESKDAVARQNAEIREALPVELRKSYDAIVQEAEKMAISDKKLDDGIDPSDMQVLAFYSAQCTTHAAHLTHAIDAFLQTVEHNQPPKVFLAHGKFVVLSAHKLVHIGDTVHRNVTRSDVRTRVLACANALSEALAATVHKTKRAAQQFPSVTAVQEMVDSVVDISHLARDLKMSLKFATQ
ncbi:breast cancer anti-estrogen resistance protein 1 isoform X2 [Macrosteles quadrilineatus]|uniref:breast cancer anti-estrogen resistance protein 1 isoform X2 n=1 Tax=Macrosteles quadrilineatus TaxID=74068 RepID=UPI0023E21867|nr:breast cancer anti-estrogen resistance protein 1 isoform X2 [Macrosteles quadrilineatus]